MISTPQELANSFRTYGDEKYAGFTSWPLSSEEAAFKFSQAILMATQFITPILLPGVAQLAATNLSVMLGASYKAGAGLSGVSSALATYATAISLGMQPAFTATPPVSPLTIISAPNTDSQTSLLNIATQIILWLRTGTAINNVSGAPVVWI